MRVGDLTERGVPGPQVTGAGDATERAVGQEGNAEFGAVGEFVLAGAERGRQLILHAGQVLLAEDLAGDVDLVDARVGDAGQPDLALVEQLLYRAMGSAYGTFGSGRWNWYSPMASTLSAFSDASTACRR